MKAVQTGPIALPGQPVFWEGIRWSLFLFPHCRREIRPYMANRCQHAQPDHLQAYLLPRDSNYNCPGSHFTYRNH